MRTILRFCIIAAIIIVSGCMFESEHELWSLSSGGQLPLQSGNYTCIFFDQSENGKPSVSGNYHIQEHKKGSTFWYVALDKAGHKSFPITFHHVRDDVFIAAYGRRDGKPGEFISLAWASADYGIAFGSAANEQIAMLSAKHNVEISGPAGDSSLKGTPTDEKAFLEDLTNNLEKAQTVTHCVHQI